MELKSPSKKGFKPSPFNAPLPICHESSDSIYLNEYDWPVFYGKFNGISVIIDEPSEIIALSNKGFFGKGSLSRGSPSICKRKSPLRVVSESQWKRRKVWAETLKKFVEVPLSNTCAKSESNSESQKAEMNSKESICTETNSEVPEKNIDSLSSNSVSLQDINNKKELVKKDDDGIFDKNLVMEKSDLSKDTCAESHDKNHDGCTKIDSIANSSTTQCKNQVEKIENSSITNLNQTKIIPASFTPDTSLVNSNSKLLDSNEILVLNDLSSLGDEPLKDLNPHIEIENIKTVIEVLYLSLEEAFFLSYALNCLQVVDLTANYLSNKDLWKLFQEAQSDFIEKYVAYHHFRSKGWVVKPGLKYGGDYLLYKKGPAYYHASYIVLVKKLNSNGTKTNNFTTWEKMSTLNRMAEAATKEILICEVKRPDIPNESFEDPSVLKEFGVGELLLRRWQPKQEKNV